MSEIKGIYAASLSILDENLALNIDKTINHAENLIDQGCHGVAIFRSTGQAQLISVKKFLIMPPAYYNYGDDEVISYFTKIVEQVSDCKIILYNFEKLCGYKFSISCIEDLVKKFPQQIIGVKDSSYNLFENIKIKNFSVLPGSEEKLLKGLKLGCSGIITATCNVTAPLARKVYEDFINNKKQTHNEKLCAVRKTFEEFNLISGLHTFLTQKEKNFKNILPTLSLLNENDKKKLFENLNKLNFILTKSEAA